MIFLSCTNPLCFCFYVCVCLPGSLPLNFRVVKSKFIYLILYILFDKEPFVNILWTEDGIREGDGSDNNGISCTAVTKTAASSYPI